MPEVQARTQANAGMNGQGTSPGPIPKRALDWTVRMWRPAGTVVTVGLALALGWYVINGNHGLSAWQQKRVEDRELSKEIDNLQRENARLRQEVERLKSDPEAIKHTARENLHYVGNNEVIVPMPKEPQTAPQPAGAGK